MPDFLSPAPAAPARVPPASTLKTPFPVRERPLPFLTPLCSVREQSEVFNHEAFISFLFNAYKVEMASREFVLKKHRKESDPDAIYAAVDECVRKRMGEYNSAQLDQIRSFYKKFSSSVQEVMQHLHAYSASALLSASPVSDEMIEAVVEGLTPANETAEFNGDEIEIYITAAAGQLIRFNDQFRNILLKESLCTSKAIWIFAAAFLGLAIGVAVHFMPVVGSALSISIPLAVNWLSLLVSIAVPALVGAASFGFISVGAMRLFARRETQSIPAVAVPNESLKNDVDRLLVQIARSLLLGHKLAVIAPAGSSARLRPRTAASAVGLRPSPALQADDVIDAGRFTGPSCAERGLAPQVLSFS